GPTLDRSGSDADPGGQVIVEEPVRHLVTDRGIARRFRQQSHGRVPDWADVEAIRIQSDHLVEILAGGERFGEQSASVQQIFAWLGDDGWVVWEVFVLVACHDGAG